MKVGIVLLALVVLISGEARSQGVSLGIAGGANLSSLNMDHAIFKPGYQVGGFAKLLISKRVGFQTEALFTNQHAVAGGQEFEINSIAIPVLLRFNLNNYINIQAGPQYNMLLNTKGNMDELTTPVGGEDLYFTLGVGVDMPLGFSASLRFINAFEEIVNNTGVIATNMVQFSVAVRFLQFEKH